MRRSEEAPAVRVRALLAAAVLAITALVAVAPAGAATPQARTSIAGGYLPHPSQWPWVTAMIDLTRTPTNGDLGRGACTAVLIAPQRVLTAAHCVVGDDNVTPKPASRFQVLVGRRDLTITTQGERRNVTGIAVHPKVYLPRTGVHTNHAFYDIAVLFLDQPITTITPATIGQPSDWNTWATAMGFGHFNYDHVNPQYDQHLRAADYDLWGDSRCADWFADPRSPGTQHYFPTIHLCANNAAGTNVDCITHGDSGGPLMIRKPDGTWRLIGITSFYPQYHHDRCRAGGPFGFAWVAGAEMRDWPLTVPHPPTGGGSSGGGGGGGSGGGGPIEIDLSMARSELPGYIRYLIRANTNGRIRGMSKRCARTNYRSFTCRLRWRIRRHRFSGTASIWAFAQDGQAVWTYVFKGKRRTPSTDRTKRLMW